MTRKAQFKLLLLLSLPNVCYLWSLSSMYATRHLIVTLECDTMIMLKIKLKTDLYSASSQTIQRRLKLTSCAFLQLTGQIE